MKTKIVKQEITKLKTKWKGEIMLSNNSTVKFTMNKQNGWEQFGASKDEMWITTPIIEGLWNEFVSQ